MNFHVSLSDAYVRVLKDLLIKCKMPHDKIHKGYKFLIVLRGVPIGGARLILSENGELGLIASVCILEEFRHIGAGQFLMKHIHKTAKLWGVSTLYLAAVGGAVPFYNRLGYKAFSKDHQTPDEFEKPMHRIWEEYESGKYPYRIKEYMKAQVEHL